MDDFSSIIKNGRKITRRPATTGIFSTLQLSTQAKWKTFWFVSWDHGSQKTFETMIRDVIATFRNTTPAVNQQFLRKVKLRQLPVTGSPTRTFDMWIMFFQATPFWCLMLNLKWAKLISRKSKSWAKKTQFSQRLLRIGKRSIAKLRPIEKLPFLFIGYRRFAAIPLFVRPVVLVLVATRRYFCVIKALGFWVTCRAGEKLV